MSDRASHRLLAEHLLPKDAGRLPHMRFRCVNRSGGTGGPRTTYDRECEVFEWDRAGRCFRRSAALFQEAILLGPPWLRPGSIPC
jgi:hypothetical protein